jgi:ABC-type branched-subunit amino acid transport system ATPase component
MLMVKQNEDKALEDTHRTCMYAIGCIELEGTTANLRSDPRIQQVFWGGRSWDYRDLN